MKTNSRSRSGHEVVYLLDDVGRDRGGEPDRLLHEMLYKDFRLVATGSARISALAGSRARMAYVQLSESLALRAMVCVRVAFDDDGALAEDWRVPLEDLLSRAGPGPDLGSGPIRLVCKGQCPIPWLNPKLWMPDLDPLEGDCARIQNAAWQNRLRLQRAQAAPMPQLAARPEPRTPERSTEERPPAPAPVPRGPQGADAGLERTLDAAFGDGNRISIRQLVDQHNKRIRELMRKHQGELEQQHQQHVRQLRTARDEVARLRARLRREQERNRQLEDILRSQ